MSERITGTTELIGLFATPIRHSSSPLMHNLAFAKLGLDYAYLAFEVGRETLPRAVDSIRALEMRGANISMPNKTVVHEYLDHLSLEARLCGSVNTIVNENGTLTGYNTDGQGFIGALRASGINISGEKLTIIGAGGASTAICVQAALFGARELSIFNRRDQFFQSAERIAGAVRDNTNCVARACPLDDEAALRREVAESQLLVNATGIGMKPYEGRSAVNDLTLFRPDLIVFDVIYAPRRTKLMELAASQGCRVLNGHGMMLYQGAAAFKLWTGREMPVDYIRETMRLDYDFPPR